MIHSVLKAIDILQLFSAAEPRLSLAQIAERLELPKSTAHNLLKTLVHRRFVEPCGDGCYALGTEIIALTHAVRINVELRDLAAPLLRTLAEFARESVYLAVLDGEMMLYIYAVESSDRLRARTAVGDRAYPHCTAVGKAVWSQLPPAEVEAAIDRIGLPRYTAATLTNRAALGRELAETAARGYALDHGEHEEHYYCVAAPIFNQRGRAIAACSISGRDAEIVGSRLPDLSGRVLYTAQEIARYLGYLPNRSSAVGAYRLQTNGGPV
jgi:DNA-binding IclR family transcriptional regulator